MIHQRNFVRLGAFAALLVAAACGENPTGPGPASPDLLVTQAQAPTQDELDRQIPGFGGFFLDADGTPTVYLLAGSDRAPAERALLPYLRGRGLQPSALQVRVAQYGYRSLEVWFHRASLEALAVDGSVFADHDESSNRVRIGVEDLGALANVRSVLGRLGIPAEAIVVEPAQPIFMVASLQNVVDRPVRAGVQINFPGYVCSVGFNATAGGQKSFTTASHCTNTQGGEEGTPYRQPLQSVDPAIIATEVDDPDYFSSKGKGGNKACPAGRRCRYSDAARAAYANGANQALGLIAGTSGPNNGSLEIVGSFTITAEDLRDHFTIGEVINKVGRTTGWTQGTVSGTCVNTGVSGTNLVQLCQTFVSSSGPVIVMGGDSGSGVWSSAGGSNVTLAGILWGGSNDGKLFVFSPLKNVERELGLLTTF